MEKAEESNILGKFNLLIALYFSLVLLMFVMFLPGLQSHCNSAVLLSPHLLLCITSAIEKPKYNKIKENEMLIHPSQGHRQPSSELTNTQPHSSWSLQPYF